jgi:hypothetical protein
LAAATADPSATRVSSMTAVQNVVEC